MDFQPYIEVAHHHKNWRRLLTSNQGLFKRLADKPVYPIIGPHIAPNDGKIVGDAETMEAAAFARVATDEQQRFYYKLKEVNPAAADEYLLTISGCIKVWKEDIRWLKAIVQYLNREDLTLRKEEILLINEKRKAEAELNLPEVLKRRFPQYFDNDVLKGKHFSDIISEIQRVTDVVKGEKNYLQDYLDKLKAAKPFLFE